MYTACAFDCFSDTYCIDRSLVCDRYKNCPNNVDEANCEYSKLINLSRKCEGGIEFLFSRSSSSTIIITIENYSLFCSSYNYLTCCIVNNNLLFLLWSK